MEINDIYNSWENLPLADDSNSLKLYPCSMQELIYPAFFSKDHLGSYLFLFPMPERVSSQESYPEEIQGCSTELVKIHGRDYFLLSLPDNDYWSIFKYLCREIFHDLQENAYRKNDTLLRQLSALLKKFSQFFKSTPLHFSREQAIGLWGELSFLKNILLSRFSPDEALLCWKGPTADDKDFVMPHTLVEVKTTESTDNKRISISNLKQLSEESGKDLYICLNVIQETDEGAGGVTLRSLVSSIRTVLENANDAIVVFNALLSMSGYQESSPLASKAYKCETREYYRVDNSFPRLTPLNIPYGVIAAKYTVDLALVAMAIGTPDFS